MGLFKFIKGLFGNAESRMEVPVQPEDSTSSIDEELSEIPDKMSKTQAINNVNRYNKPTSKVMANRKARDTWQRVSANHSRETVLVIGFDLGTSCTKVILQDGVLKRAYAVRFDHVGYANNRYLLPTEVAVRRDGILSLEKNGTIIDSLKMRFLENPSQPIEPIHGVTLTAAEATAAYIGLVLKQIRKWFWAEKLFDYQDVNIEWQLNIGMSSRSYDDHPLKWQMKQVALAGWNLTLEAVQEINLIEIKKAIRLAKEQISEDDLDENSEQIHPDNVCPIPEIISQVAGYARSPMRQNGMYLLVDVGASTLDVSTFIIHENDGEDLYTILVAEVEKLGALAWHKHRMSNADDIICKYAGGVKAVQFMQDAQRSINAVCSGVAPLPNIESHFPPLSETALDEYRSINLDFMVECSLVVRKVIKESKQRKNPNSLAWQYGLPVFLCGGGSQLGIFQDIIPHAQRRLENTDFFGFELKRIPKPLNLETDDIPPRDYHRMSVAYGLSFPSIDIGEVIPPAMVDDLVINDKIREISTYFIDKDMV